MKCFIQHPRGASWPCSSACFTRDAQEDPVLCSWWRNKRQWMCLVFTGHGVCWKSPRTIHTGKRENSGISLKCHSHQMLLLSCPPPRLWILTVQKRPKGEISFLQWILENRLEATSLLFPQDLIVCQFIGVNSASNTIILKQGVEKV